MFFASPFAARRTWGGSVRLVFVGLMCTSYRVARADSLNYADFSSTSGLALNGSATSSGGNLVLASQPNFQAGSAFTTSRVNISAFTTSFQFQLVPTTNPPADGITFSIQGVSPTALGGAGGGLGYAGIQSSVAVKFDDYYNNYENGVQHVDPSNSTTGLLTDGNTPPGEDLSGSGIYLNTRDVFQASLSYTGSTLGLTIKDVTTGISTNRSFNVDIQSFVGADTAYVGFTGGTGTLAASEQIEKWSFDSPSVMAAPLPSTAWGGVALFGGLAVIGAARRVRQNA
jgi:hypothetical protein